MFLLIFWNLLLSVLVSAAPDVTLSRGILKGVDEDVVATRKTYHVYYGIPFATPPLGNLRFKPPQPFLSRDPNQVINSQSFRSACIQMQSPFGFPQSEDCLYLNVYTPSVGGATVFPQNSNKKVMVWIHGGGYTFGEAMSYRPTRLVTDHDVIVVTTQYRLGPFGFLSSGDDALPGNIGLYDQIMALRWVKTNIRLFGGNPDDVTLFGESAGSSSASILALSPLASGLFTKVILQSGTALSTWAVNRKPADMFYEIAKRAKCLPMFYFPFVKSLQLTYNQKIVQCLERMPPRDLYRLLPIAEDQGQDNDSNMFSPNVDGTLLPRDPFSLVADQRYLQRIGATDITYLIGFTNNEAMLFKPLMDIFNNKDWPVTDPDDSLTRGYLRNMLEFTLRSPVSSDVLNFASMLYLYPRDWQGKVEFQGIADLMSDTSFVVPAVQLARALVRAASQVKVFMYVLDLEPPLKDADYPLTGSSHGLDLLFLFDPIPELTSIVPAYEDLESPTYLPFFDVIRGAFTNLAKFGNPSQTGSPQWPAYDLENESYMSLQSQPQVRRRVFRRRVSFWTDFLPRAISASSSPARAAFRV